MLAAMAAGVLALGLTWRPTISAIDRPQAGSFPAAQVNQGAILAKLGDCAVCHTAAGGRALAGGRPLATPFGTLFASNITPDAETGIGNWSYEAFRRAMRDGVSRTGSHLYPALPYDHYTHVTEGDLQAIYAYLMTRRPVHAPKPDNKLIFPLGFRPFLAGWKFLYLRHGDVPYDSGQSARYNRGAYLAEGLGHCGGCHTPRNLMGAEVASKAYAGGIAEGWRAPPLNAENPAARKWTADSLYTFLRTGVSPDHSAAGGPMGPVVESLSSVPEEEVRALSVYFAAKMGKAAPAKAEAAPVDRPAEAAAAFPEGARIFAGACAGCHGPGAPMMSQGRPALGLSTDLTDSEPTSAIQAVLQGIEPPVEGRGPKMPAFAPSLTDGQVAAVLGYVRTRYTHKPAWNHLEHDVRQARKEGGQP